MPGKSAASKRNRRWVKDKYGNAWKGTIPVTPADLADVQQKLGLIFPAALIALFEGFAGGEPKRPDFDS